MNKHIKEIEEIAKKCSNSQSDGYSQIMRICDAMKMETDYFEVGDIVDMHCGEQGIVVEILDNEWVYLLQCNGHIEKAYAYDIWPSERKCHNGKEALHELFMKTFGYSGIYEDEPDNDKECEILPIPDNMEEPPF